MRYKITIKATDLIALVRWHITDASSSAVVDGDSIIIECDGSSAVDRAMNRLGPANRNAIVKRETA